MSDESEVRAAAARFYEAVNHVLCDGNPAPMLRFWSHADDATYCDTRGEVQRGWQALEAYWKNAAAANAQSDVRLSAVAELLQVVVGGDVAYIVASEHVTREGDPNTLHARATNVFRRENGEWRMIHRHADAPPKIDVPDDAAVVDEGAEATSQRGEVGHGER
jgi:ketosteroid isomerase-like protein